MTVYREQEVQNPIAQTKGVELRLLDMSALTDTHSQSLLPRQHARIALDFCFPQNSASTGKHVHRPSTCLRLLPLPFPIVPLCCSRLLPRSFNFRLYTSHTFTFSSFSLRLNFELISSSYFKSLLFSMGYSSFSSSSSRNLTL